MESLFIGVKWAARGAEELPSLLVTKWPNPRPSTIFIAVGTVPSSKAAATGHKNCRQVGESL